MCLFVRIYCILLVISEHLLDWSNLSLLDYSYFSYPKKNHDLWFEQLPKKKECNETWCRAPAGIRTESPRNCTTVQPWTEYSSSSRWRSLRLKYQPGSRIGSWSAGISTPCSLATCHVQTHRHWVQTAARAHSYEINPLKLPCDTLRQREREISAVIHCIISRSK